jgi:predicted DNA binding protein
MAITAKLHVRHERLALVPTLRRLDGIEIRVITQGTTDPRATDFPFQIEYPNRETLEAALDEDPTVDGYRCIDWTDETGRYYIEHTDETELISTVVTDVDGFLAETVTRDDGWLVQLQLPDREALTVVWEYATDHNMSLDIIEIYGNTTEDGRQSYGLTDEQLAALRIAYEMGYFQEPRDISLNEVAEEIGLSSTAMSGRLRRGMRNLIATTIAREDR